MSAWRVLLAHGSRDEAWRVPFDELTAEAQTRLAPDVVRLAFLQLSEPTLNQIVAEAAEAGADRISVLPLFLAQGRHVSIDIERLVSNLRASHPQMELDLRASVGSDARLWTLLTELAIEKLRDG